MISALILSGCSLVSDPERDCPRQVGESENIALSFRMVSSDIRSSRADGLHEEEDSEYPEFEDYIDINNFAFYVFMQNETTSVDDDPLVMKVTDIANSTDPNQMITGSNGAYTITTLIPKANLENILGHEITANSKANVTFRVVLLANTKFSAGGDYNTLAPTDPVCAGELASPTTFGEFMENAQSLNANLNDIFNLSEGDSGITGLYKGTIPMFGMTVYTTNEELLYKSRPEERIYMGDIFMLRSLAKIRVIDNAPKDDEGYPFISSVEVEGRTNMFAQLPANASNYVNGLQVHDINALGASGASESRTYKLGYLRESTKATRFGYLPEQSIAYGLPVIKVTAQLDANRTEVYSIPMTGGSDYPGLTFGDAILRNHIYTLSVNSITVGIPAELNVEVEEWIDHPLELSYTETVTVNPRIEWRDGTYFNINEEFGEVYVRPWSGDNPVLLQCTFKIRTPENARWTAYLIPKDGTINDAFQFTDKDGNDASSSVSGTVTNNMELTTLYIKPTIQAPTELNSSILQVVVTLGNGTTIEVPLTPSNRNYKNFTIVQNPQQ
ncbi:MAG: hypothetical protein K2N25_06935 [Muribaculaceae bacterium]|nr:hypothetical protein [Muribaculaceae bacterium]